MTKKKKIHESDAVADSVHLSSQPQNGTSSEQQKSRTSHPPSRQPTLMICRNKHWRYISSYHGPWLNLPLEVLESLAYNNFYSPQPQPIDPATFFDLVQIRRLIDDATSLAVRATNGTTSAALTSSLNASNGYLNGADVELLGIGSSKGGGHAKLSKERRHRMREHAIQKLSHAYRLDEIAASVATMQSASALEEVAKHVLQRDTHNPDAQYVHFFHEKIPSRALAECTNLSPLNNIIQQRPTEAGPYRTRAVTRMLKDDYIGATRDLTDGLAVHRIYNPEHENRQREMILAKDAPQTLRNDGHLDEKDQSSSLEPQLLFHRAGAYLTLACNHIAGALQISTEKSSCETSASNSPLLESSGPNEQTNSRIQARKLVRTFAKRALKDCISFLSHFDYTPGLSVESTDAFLDQVKHSIPTERIRNRSQRLLDIDTHTRNGLSEVLTKHQGQRTPGKHQTFSQIAKPTIYKVSDLFSAVPPPGLSPYPPKPAISRTTDDPAFSLPEFTEAVTYHPLLTEVLHSLLLCHCLIQTSRKEHLRHALMVARIARVCDGYPIFLSARSPARADWMEVLRCTGDWLELGQSWEALCSPATMSDQQAKATELECKTESTHKKFERIKREAIREALADERVIDEDSFKASVKAREVRAIAEEDEEMRKEYNSIGTLKSTDLDLKPGHSGEEIHFQPTRMAQEDGKESSVTTDRAEAIARWIRYAPPPSATLEGRTKKSGAKKPRLKKEATDMSVTSRLEGSIESLEMVD